jgi:hypothetical protein
MPGADKIGVGPAPEVVGACDRCGQVKYDNGVEHHLAWCEQMSALEEQVEALEDLVVYLWDSGVEGEGDDWDTHAQRVLKIKERRRE